MASPNEVLADNLREALGATQRMLLQGTLASVVFMLLAMDPPGQPDGAAVAFARMLSLMVALVTGAMAAVAAQQACRVLTMLRRSTALHNAMVTFPSIMTVASPLPRLFFALAPGFMLAAGAQMVWLQPGASPLLWLVVVAVSLPYVVLGWLVRRPMRRVSLAGI